MVTVQARIQIADHCAQLGIRTIGGSSDEILTDCTYDSSVQFVLHISTYDSSVVVTTCAPLFYQSFRYVLSSVEVMMVIHTHASTVIHNLDPRLYK